jgi:4-deoxy-L-threo-5-hexosulose-uronate ketol-isomerase
MSSDVSPLRTSREATVQTRHPTHPDELAQLPAPVLRDRFLVEDLFVAGEVRLAYSHHDRIVVGGAVPDGQTLTLPVPQQLRAQSFLDRRELGVVCLSGTGTVSTEDAKHPMGPRDVLYIGRGATGVAFAGADARFYLVSTPAHAEHPTALARRDEVASVHLGDRAHANVRTIRKYIHADGVNSCQLVLGITDLDEGSVWNTMPCHTHERRTEVYLYFGLDSSERVLHLCGQPDATRSIVVANEQVVISPPWSVHCGAGTANYAFVWAMGGENLAYDDMEVVAKEDLR